MKVVEVQSGLNTDTMCELFWDWCWTDWDPPEMCSIDIDISKCATKNHMERSRCITTGSLALETAATTPVLSHWNRNDLRTKRGPQIAQLVTIGTSSFAIIASGAHS